MPLLAVLDSGATETLIKEELFDALKGTYISKESHALSSILQSSVPNVGKGTTDINVGHGVEIQTCIVVAKKVTLPTPIILSLDFIFKKAVVVRPLHVSRGGGGDYY